MSENAEMHLYAPGHAGCPGCGPSIALINLVDALGKDTIIVNPTGCMEITSSQYPLSAWRVPYIHSLFENAAAVASGISNALKAKGNNHSRVAVIGGDGSAYDIGFGALSGMLDRREDVIFICYDNEQYANTGVQKSSATPFKAATTTTPVGSVERGKLTPKKELAEIAAAHGIAYAANASIAFLPDLRKKIEKCKAVRGPSVLVVNAPCVLGAGFDGALTIKVARLAVQTRSWHLMEIEDGKMKLNFKPKEFVPVSEYLSLQKRFKYLTPQEVSEIQEIIERNWARRLALSGEQPYPLAPANQQSKASN
ncbi:MAG: thiamine pyrophosphate-dependent enzyme [Candidatus Micrarchaeia archaeon]|jgi:pyruvate ferredoxin oxidoreductase beta subunit